MKRSITPSILEIIRPLKKPWVWLVAILAFTAYLRILYFGQFIDIDVGNIAYQAWRMSKGDVIIDLEGPGKPPLYPMVYSIFIRLFGPSVIGLKFFGTIFVLLAVITVYWLAKQAYGKKVGLLAALFFGVFSSGPIVDGGTVNTETILHLPYILAIGLFLKASMSGRLRWYFLAGITATLATLVKQVGGVLFFVFLCYGIGECWREKDSLSRRHYFYHYILLVAGALLPIVALTIFYHFHGYALNQLYDSMLVSNIRYIQRGHESTKCFQFFYLSMKDILSENILLWVGTLFAVVHMNWRIWNGKGQPSDRILFWWAFWSFAILWATGTFISHYFLQIIAPFSVLAAFGIVSSWELTNYFSLLIRRGVKAVWMTLLVTMVIIFIKTDYKYFFSYTPTEQTILQHEAPKGMFDVYGLYNVVQHGIASYIHDHTDPTETIYIWGISPQIYFLAQRKAATRYRNNFNMSPNVTGNPMEALRGYAPIVIEDLRKSPPAYIVRIFPLEDFPELQNFIQEKYIIDNNIDLTIPVRGNFAYRINLYQRRPNIDGPHP